MLANVARRVLLVGAVLAISVAFTSIHATTAKAGAWDAPGGTCEPSDPPIPHPGLPEFFEYKCVCRTVSGVVRCNWELVAKSGGSSPRATGYAYSSSTYGCLFAVNVLQSQNAGGLTNAGAGQVIGENYPCDHASLKSQPAGEYRSQAVLEYFGGGAWHACTALGYRYNQVTGWGVTDGSNMGGVPDCGNATYRMSNTVGIYEGGAWRGGTLWAPSVFMN